MKYIAGFLLAVFLFAALIVDSGIKLSMDDWRACRRETCSPWTDSQIGSVVDGAVIYGIWVGRQQRKEKDL